MQKAKFLIIAFILMFALSACFTPEGSASVPTITSPPIITPDSMLTPTAIVTLDTTAVALNNPTAVITLEPPAVSPLVTPLVTAIPATAVVANDVSLPALGGSTVTCTPPAGWVPYTVQDGDAISSLS